MEIRKRGYYYDKRKSDFDLPKLDDLFTTQEMRDDAKLERVQNIPLNELHPFKNHPFKILNNAEMERMIESIRKVGAIIPALARPLTDGGYELISGTDDWRRVRCWDLKQCLLSSVRCPTMKR